jgi:tetratricopeptide (TPR) repeat protein
VAIEGPLRELGIHDVFQLLDLSRKTGALRLRAELLEDEGLVYFEQGRVVYAELRSNPRTLGAALVRAGKVTDRDLASAREVVERGGGRKLGDALVELGAISTRELERQARVQIEDIVFELMSWREGTFSFEEGSEGAAPSEATVRVSIESLLMEGARRIDEWSRIADKVPHLGVVPALAPVKDDDPPLLDLRPAEWEVLAAVDGVRDLRAIAAALAASEFDVAKTAYGLATTGVIEVLGPQRGSSGAALPVEDAAPHVARSAAALGERRFEEALAAAREGIAADPGSAEARLAAARALLRLGRAADATEELRRAAQADPLHPEVQFELGFAAARRGDLAGAVASWEHYLRMAPRAEHAEQARAAREAAARMQRILEAHADV